MAGENDRIHSYNPVYRSQAGAPQFYSFQRRNGQFINQPVSITDGTLGIYDHQGHIVPQNILNQVLNGERDQMFAQCINAPAAAAYALAGPPWLRDAYNYGLQLGIPMFDFDNPDAEGRLGMLFSIVTWNPINLCRAPSDDQRGGYPGNNIDRQVVNYLSAHQGAQGVNGPWLAALNNLINNTGTVTQYLNACSATLAGQLVGGIGFYQFQWEYADQEDQFLKLSPDIAETGGKVLIPFKK